MLAESRKLYFWRRFFAFIIDIIIIQFIVNLAFYSSLKKYFYEVNIFGLFEMIKSGQEIKIITTVTIVSAIVSLFYWSVLEYKMKGSIGQLLVNLNVESKVKPHYWQFFVRNISKSLFFIGNLNIILLIDIIYSFFAKERLFDRISKTKVVMSKKIIRKFKKNK